MHHTPDDRQGVVHWPCVHQTKLAVYVQSALAVQNCRLCGVTDITQKINNHSSPSIDRTLIKDTVVRTNARKRAYHVFIVMFIYIAL